MYQYSSLREKIFAFDHLACLLPSGCVTEHKISLAASTPYYDDPGAMYDSRDCHSSDLYESGEDVKRLVSTGLVGFD